MHWQHFYQNDYTLIFLLLHFLWISSEWKIKFRGLNLPLHAYFRQVLTWTTTWLSQNKFWIWSTGVSRQGWIINVHVEAQSLFEPFNIIMEQSKGSHGRHRLQWQKLHFSWESWVLIVLPEANISWTFTNFFGYMQDPTQPGKISKLYSVSISAHHFPLNQKD